MLNLIMKLWQSMEALRLVRIFSKCLWVCRIHEPQDKRLLFQKNLLQSPTHEETSCITPKQQCPTSPLDVVFFLEDPLLPPNQSPVTFIFTWLYKVVNSIFYFSQQGMAIDKKTLLHTRPSLWECMFKSILATAVHNSYLCSYLHQISYL